MKKGNLLFYLFITLAIISFGISVAKYNSWFNLNFYGGAYSPLTFNLEMPKGTENVFLVYNESEKAEFSQDMFPYQTLAPQNEIYSIAVIEEPKIKELELFVGKDSEKDLKKLIIFNNAQEHFYENIYGFEHETKEFCQDENTCEEYDVYKIPREISVDTKYDTYNYRGIQHNILLILLSVVYSPQFFLLFWLFLACAYAVTKIKKLDCDIQLSPNAEKFILPAIILLGIALRTFDILLYPLWNDEIGILIVGRRGILTDPGTPPLAIILIKYWRVLFGSSLLSLRIFPLIFSVLNIYAIYEFIKTAGKDKFMTYAGTFLLSINIFAVYLSQEVRSYSLAMLISALSGLYLFKLLENPSKKNLILYTITGILAFNTHYYLILLVAFNFIYYISKRYKNIAEIRNFVIGHIIVGLSFLPSVLTIVISAWQNAKFDSWIPPLSLHHLKETAIYFFGDTRVFWGIVIFLAAYYLVLFLKPKVLEHITKDEKTLFDYCVGALVFITATALVISFKRQIFYTKYFLCVLPMFIVVYSMFLNVFFKTKLWILHIFAAGTVILMHSRFIPEVARAEYLQDPINHIAAYESLEDARQGNKVAMLVADKITTKEEADYVTDEFDYFIYVYPESVLPHIFKRLDEEGYTTVYTDAIEDNEIDKFMEHAKDYSSVKLIFNNFMYKRIVKTEKR